MALAPDISGVCRVEETLEITSTPTNTLRMKIVSQTTGSLMTAPLPGRVRVGSCRDLAGVGDAGAGDDLVLEVGGEGRSPSRTGHQGDHVDDVLGVEPATPGRASARARSRRPRPGRCRSAPPCPAATPSTLPPDSAARSTTTEPGFICSTIVGGDQQRRLPAGHGGGGDQRVGGGDVRRQQVALPLRRGPRSSPGHSRRRPPASRARARSPTAPIERISSAAAARTSYALTTAPSRGRWRSPAGRRRRRPGRPPGPGGTVPAAVMFSGKNWRSSPAATIAQR